MSVRERSRQRPEQLERNGWRYLPLWTIDVFSDPAGCASTVASYLGLPAAGEGPGGDAQDFAVDDDSTVDTTGLDDAPGVSQQEPDKPYGDEDEPAQDGDEDDSTIGVDELFDGQDRDER